jgi:hypothetical protein
MHVGKVFKTSLTCLLIFRSPITMAGEGFRQGARAVESECFRRNPQQSSEESTSDMPTGSRLAVVQQIVSEQLGKLGSELTSPDSGHKGTC